MRFLSTLSLLAILSRVVLMQIVLHGSKCQHRSLLQCFILSRHQNMVYQTHTFSPLARAGIDAIPDVLAYVL